MRKPIALLMIALVIVFSAMAQAPTEPEVRREGSPHPVPAASPGRAPEMTATDVEAFLDGLVPLQLKTSDIAGVTVSVVKDGKLFFAKGK